MLYLVAARSSKRRARLLLLGRRAQVILDGDTPHRRRGSAREARVLFTNADMLHAHLLPRGAYDELLSGLSLLVLDEVHRARRRRYEWAPICVEVCR